MRHLLAIGLVVVAATQTARADENEKADEFFEEAFAVKKPHLDLDSQLDFLRDHRQWEVRARQAWTLGHGEPSPEVSAALIEALLDPHYEVRRWSAWSLGRLGGPGAADALYGVPATDDARVRTAAAEALVRLGDDRGYPLLVTLMNDPDPRAAILALEALARNPSERHLGDLLDVLQQAARDPRPAVRGHVLIVLERLAILGEERLAALLELLADDPHPYVRAVWRGVRERLERPRR